MSKRRVVVTGMGVITPLGLTVDDFWEGLITGKSGIGPITQFDTTDFPVKVAAEIHDFNPLDYMDIKTVDRTGRFTQFAIAAAKMAAEQSGLDFETVDHERIGVSLTNVMDIKGIVQEQEVLKSRGPKRINPLFVPKTGPHMPSIKVGMLFKARGPNTSSNSACASGADAVATGYDLIKLGYADVMIAGGTDSAVAELPIASMAVLGALSREADPAKASRPFDLNRKGFVYGEGAGILVLESLEHALNRGAVILGELAGISRTFDAYNETSPDPRMQAVAMMNALNVADAKPEDVDYINAHGTSTKLNDRSETEAIKTVFGKRAYEIPVSSIKSMIGHILTAAGAIEAIVSVLAINKGIIPPTTNYETPDPDCDLDYVPNVARSASIDCSLSNSFGLGGQNCCLVLKRYKQ
ncbi:beta-ketoacyl-ACP synthase II [Chloroflexota bacterium]